MSNKGIVGSILLFICLLSALILTVNNSKTETYNTVEYSMKSQCTVAPEAEIATVSTPVVETPYYYEVNLDNDLQDYIRTVCDTYDVPMSLVIALIDHESDFIADAVSSTDDWGLMQLNSINHEWLSEKFGLTDILDPYQNVTGGIYLLSEHLRDTNGNIQTALMCYNCGEVTASYLWDSGIYSTEYSESIYTLYLQYEAEQNK